MFKEKSGKKPILSNNENKTLINNLIDQIEFLKNDGNQIEKFVTLKKLRNSKYQTIKILATLHLSTVLKY